MKHITIIGSGERGLETGLKLSELGFQITCLSNRGQQEQDLDNKLIVTEDKMQAYKNATIIFVDFKDKYQESLSYEPILDDLAEYVRSDFILVLTNETPIGANKLVLNQLREKFGDLPILFDVVSNPGGLYGLYSNQDCMKEIVVGTRCRQSEEILEYLFKPYKNHIRYTNPERAESSCTQNLAIV